MRPQRLAALVLVASGLAQSQSVIQTVLGGSPNNTPALAATLYVPIAVVADTSGNFYTAAAGLNQIIKVDPQGIASIYAGTGGSGYSGDGGPAAAAQVNGPAGMARDAAGNLYIADSFNNVIRKVSTNGIISTYAGNGKTGYTGDGGPALQARMNYPVAIAFDSHGDLYIADVTNNVIRMVTPNGIISTFAGVGTPGVGGDRGPAMEALLDQPMGVAVDSNNNVYIADSANNTVRVVGTNGIINQFAGDYEAGYTGDGGYAISAFLNSPTGLLVDAANNVYILDQNNERVRRVTPNGFISNYAGCGVPGAAGDEGLATGATLDARGIGMDIHNNLYIADGPNNRVREVTASNGIINTVAGNGLPSITPRGIVVSGQMLYYVDFGTNRVRALDLTTGQVALIAGTGSAGWSGDGYSALTAELSAPRGLAIDSAGNFYIADTGNQVIRQINTQGIIHTVAGTAGTATTTGDGGLATSATLNQPVDVAVNSAGDLYIAEAAGGRIRMVNTAGTISTVVGGGSDLSGTGPGIDESLSNPSGLAIEPAGTLLLSDTGHYRVLRLAINGTISVVAGGNGAGFAGDGGPATAAKLRSPNGLSEDSAGNIYIADTTNDAVRQVGTDGIIATVAGLPPNSAGLGTSGYNGDGSPATNYSLDQPFELTAVPGCIVYISDTSNFRIRKLSLGVEYTINTSPSGLQAVVDGQTVTTPASFNWLPGTLHAVSIPAQSGGAGTQYVGSAAQSINVPCGPARQTVTVQTAAQYLLTLNPGAGGTITGPQGFQNAGSQVTLTATPYLGYVFSGWTGACSGQGTCVVTMNAPETVGASFTASGSGPQPTINSGGIITAGAFGGQTTIAPGTWIEIYGSNLSPVTASWTTANFNGNTAPSSLSGVTVTVAGVSAYVSYVSAGQIDAQVPSGVSAGQAAVVVANGYGTSAPAMVTVAAVQPGLYNLGNGYIGAFEAGTSPAPGLLVVAPVGSPGYAAVQPGEAITFYGIGFGPVSPAVPAGQIATAANQLTTPLTVTIGGANATIGYAGLSVGSVGLYQINVTVPAVAAGNQPVAINLGGVAGTQTLLLTVGQ
ncbi:MAG TPA: hypothetical protein VIY49_37215 [Bryobacteraceae bacterium]